MPGLVAFKRRWNVGSDDLFFPAIIELSIRTVWLSSVFTVFLTNELFHECNESVLLHLYLIGLQSWLFLVIFLNATILYVSTKGTIAQPRPRKHMPILLYARGFLLFVELGWTIVGTIWAFKLWEGCDSAEAVILVQITTISSWFMLVCYSFGIWLTYDPLGCSGKKDVTWVGKKSLKVWQRRLKFIFFSALFDGNSRNAYRGVAQVVADYFQDVDLVPSDIAAGLILLQEKLLLKNEQKGLQPAFLHFENYENGGCTEADLNFASSSKPEWMNIDNGIHFYKFAAAMYGSPYYLYLHCVKGFFRLWRHIRCCGGCCLNQERIKGDNCCLGTLATLKTMKVIESEDDVIYASFKNKLFESPFAVILDHETKSVVIAIRGSLSLRDALTDLVCDNEPFHVEGCPENVTCHHGIYKTAQRIKEKLLETKALETAFSQCPEYHLVIAGHSLGASAGSLLAIMLRPTYPHIRCYAYAASSGLISMEGSLYCEDFVFTMVFGDDLVARLSIHAMAELKKEVIECLLECNEPKYKVFVQSCWSVVTGKPSKKNVINSREPSPNQIRPLFPSILVSNLEKNTFQMSNETVVNVETSPQSPPKVTFNRSDSVYVPNFTSIDSTRTRLHPPGSILYIRRTPEGYKASWKPPEHFNEFVISTSMGCDHMPHKLEHALSEIKKAKAV